MRIPIILFLLLLESLLSAQEFECDQSMYVVVYTQSTGISTLYKLTEEADNFSYQSIELSEDRRLTSLVYNVLDKHLYALDFDTYELVKINRSGSVISLGVPENIDKSMIYHSGTISPDGAGIYLIGNNPDFGYDYRFGTINLSRTNYYTGYLGVTGDRKVEVHDFATDPMGGVMYGYDNLDGRLIQIEIGGQMSTVNYPTTGITSMDGLFFNQSGQLYGFSARSGLYAIDKHTGETKYLRKGPEGTSGDACACPYTSSFTKIVNPAEIIPCEEFVVTYEFRNHLGIGQTWLDLRDTFPEGFEIISIESSIVNDFNIIPSAPNIFALKNIIYLLGNNTIKVKVKSSSDFYGVFKTQGVQWDFPLAYGTIQYSDDPQTTVPTDATEAIVLRVEELDFNANVQFSCDGLSAVISSPINADSYNWSTGSTEESIYVTEPGHFSLIAENECVLFSDEVTINEFPAAKSGNILGDDEVLLGSSIMLRAITNMTGNLIYTWTFNDSIRTCMCDRIDFKPSESVTVYVTVEDEQGCTVAEEHRIKVIEVRNTYSPTAFTPNDDNINDRFYIQSSSDGIMRELKIYNRWGNQIYFGKNIPLNDDTYGWDGKMADTVLPSGVYIWMANIEYFDGFLEILHGEIVLIGR